MEPTPTYEELKKRVALLEKEAADCLSAEASLRRSNEIVNSVLSAAPIGIGLVENRIIKRVNDAMMRMFRFDSDADYLGKSARIVYPSEEDFQKVGDFIYNYLKAGKEAWLDAMFRRKDGTTFWGHLKVSTLYPPDPMQRAHLPYRIFHGASGPRPNCCKPKNYGQLLKWRGRFVMK